MVAGVVVVVGGGGGIAPAVAPAPAAPTAGLFRRLQSLAISPHCFRHAFTGSPVVSTDR